MEHTTCFNDLPVENRLEIFSRLPLQLVLDCRKVCKPWRNLLHFQNNAAFAHLHLSRQCCRRRGLEGLQKRLLDANHDDDDISHDGSDFSSMSLVVFDGKKFYYGEFFDNYGGEYIGYDTKKINLEFPADVCGFVGSYNGLICLSVAMKCKPIQFLSNPGDGNVLEGFNRKSVEPLYICNPVTREIVTLPALSIKNKKNNISVAHGFGYHPLTKEYKVVRIWYGSIGSSNGVTGHVEVYTLGSGSGWQSKGKIDYYVVPNDENGNNCVNGSLHWLKYGMGEIVAFDLAEEEFHFVHTPPGLSSNTPSVISSRIFVMRGCLCLSYEYAKVADLWMLKKNDEKNAGSSNLCNAKDQYYKSRSWIKESHVGFPSVNRVFKIFGLSQEGDVVLRHIHGFLSQYNAERGGVKVYMTERNNKAFYSRIISHVNSFISLKALGETNVETCKGSKDADDEVISQSVPAYIVEDYYSL